MDINHLGVQSCKPLSISKLTNELWISKSQCYLEWVFMRWGICSTRWLKSTQTCIYWNPFKFGSNLNQSLIQTQSGLVRIRSLCFQTCELGLLKKFVVFILFLLMYIIYFDHQWFRWTLTFVVLLVIELD